LVLALVVWGAILWVLGIPLTWDLAKPYTFTLTALTAIFAAFDKFLWHTAPFSWFVKKPDIRGTWKVEKFTQPSSTLRQEHGGSHWPASQSFVKLTLI
jgi:hypothetical protein